MENVLSCRNQFRASHLGTQIHCVKLCSYCLEWWRRTFKYYVPGLLILSSQQALEQEQKHTLSFDPKPGRLKFPVFIIKHVALIHEIEYWTIIYLVSDQTVQSWPLFFLQSKGMRNEKKPILTGQKLWYYSSLRTGNLTRAVYVNYICKS